MKKICGLLIVMLLLTGCGKNELKITTGTVLSKHKFVIEKANNCSKEIKEYYELSDRKIYFNCLNEIYLQLENERIALKEHLSNANKSLDDNINEIANMLQVEEMLDDGGSIVYKDSGAKKTSVDGFTMIVCNTLNGNKDIYFGPIDIDYQDYCSNK